MPAWTFDDTTSAMDSMNRRHPAVVTPLAWARAAKTGAHALGWAPLVLLIWKALTDRLGANPIEAIERHTGWWTLALLLAGLAVTPIRRLTGCSGIAPLRRTLGLFAFCWAGVHLAAYVGLDQFFSVADIAADVVKRPYITVGFATFLLLIPLAVTSTSRMIHRLGSQRWRRLHRLVYLAAVGGVVHFLWLVKADISRPLLAAALLVLLLTARLGRVRAPTELTAPAARSRRAA